MATAEAATGRAALSSNKWWVALLEGIALIIIGVLLFSDTEQTVFTLVLFLGIWWFISGIFDLVSLFVERTQWGWKLFSGILGIVAGLMIIRHPLWAGVLVPVTLVWLVSIFGIVIGVVLLVRAFQGEGWGAGVLGVMSILLGVVLLGANLGISVLVLIYVGATCAIVGGILAIVSGFRLRRA